MISIDSSIASLILLTLFFFITLSLFLFTFYKITRSEEKIIAQIESLKIMNELNRLSQGIFEEEKKPIKTTMKITQKKRGRPAKNKTPLHEEG